jgi:hypothetical protein
MWDFDAPHLKGYAEKPKHFAKAEEAPEPNLILNVLTALLIGVGLGLVWKTYHWSKQRDTAAFYEKQQDKQNPKEAGAQ